MVVAVDLFAGPGGWSEGLRMLGHAEIGVEWDETACATARAAGHERLQADVAALDPLSLPPTKGLIVSPPCPTFSSAGNGNGRLLTDLILNLARDLAAGRDTRAEAKAAAADLLAQTEDRDRAERDAAMSILVVEPLRWALARKPQWIALEQVPPVLPIWRAFAEILREHGWHVWTGVLEAERYGVPQTRERAILLAHRDRQPHPPAPTHQRYVPGEPQRHDFTLEGEILPWVSMAEALGWNVQGDAVRFGNQDHSAVRATDEPAATLRYGERSNACDWIFQATNDRPNVARRPSSAPAPAPALAHGHNAPRWVNGRPASTAALQGDDRPDQRPATTVAGDSRIFQPGGHHEQGQQSEGSIRVTPQEAAILQSFPPDYPWQGSRSKVFQCIGNAVPPLLARAVFSTLIDEASARQAA